MILSTSLAPADEASFDEATAAARCGWWAAWRWGGMVTLFLLAQLGLGYAAVRTALSDGGERLLPDAEARVTVTDPTAEPIIKPTADRGAAR